MVLLFSILVFICLISAFISCSLGVFVLAKNPASAVNRLFFATMVGATYWALGEYLLWTAGSVEGTTFWLRASAFWPVVVALAVHFVVTYTGSPITREKHPVLLLSLLYIPAFVFSVIGVCTDALYSVSYEAGIGWVYHSTESPVYLASAIYIVVIMFWAVYRTILSWLHAKQEKIRDQRRLVSTGLIIVIIYGSLSGVVYPFYGISIPNEVFIGIVFFSLLIAYAIQRYGLFTLTPETAVPDILRTMPEGVIIADPGGKILVANAAAAEILKTPMQVLTGREVQSFLPEPVGAAIWSGLRTEGKVSGSEAALRQGEYCAVSISGTLVRDPCGGAAGCVLILRDITDRKAKETALRVANEKISILSQMTRHDIGNLVTALHGYLDLLGETNDKPECRGYIAACSGIVEKISRHLQFSREYQEIGSNQPAWQQLDRLIERGISAFPHEGIIISTRVAPVEVYTDPLAFKVMYNLFENAVRHGGGNVTRFAVSTREEPDGTLSVVFEDNGMGVKDEDKQKIFEYGQGSHTGIGLSLSRDILQMTGIRIAETGTAGEGARFEISVPPGAWRTLRFRTW